MLAAMVALVAVPASVLAATDLAKTPYDALVLVAHTPLAETTKGLGPVVADVVRVVTAADASLARSTKTPSLAVWPFAPGGRVVLASVGALAEDTDDVRAFGEAAAAAMQRAVDAGATSPLLVVAHPADPRFARALEVATLRALGSQWAPLEAREAGKARRVAEQLGVVGLSEAAAKELAAIELGRQLCRDIATTEPERMAPRRVAAACQEAFAGTGVSVKVELDVSDYPLLAAVARASQPVERHRPCVVELHYRPSGAVQRTVILVGKGVTYDTGGADLKTDGAMAGMSRDKGGAAAVAGVLRAVAALAPHDVEVIGLLGMVRNSIGSDSYVTDEIIASRAGVRVRIGNTDAEGRLVLADLLARARELATGRADAYISTVATLTGHVYRAYGPYTGVVGNRPARDAGIVARLDAAGEAWGEPMEESRPRREDYTFVAGKTGAEDVLSGNSAPSVSTPRGHQFPFAFLDIASGLKATSIPFTHIDIGGSAYAPADWQSGFPTAAPMLSLLSVIRGEP